jgi:two-component system, OmpR family, sensor histidine kinase KdpD
MAQEINSKAHIAIAVFSVSTVAAICYTFVGWMGYRSVALVLLLVVSILAMRLNLLSVVIAAVVSAGVWDYFFIPPQFAFHISSGEDILFIAMYFIVALLNGIINYRLRQLEQMKNKHEERLMAIRLYNTLFSSLSHELRTPIAAILGASDALQEQDAILSETQKKELLSEISAGSLRLSEQVENLLNVSRLDAGIVKAKFAWCDITDLIFGVVEKLKSEGSNHPVEVIIPDDFPLVQLDFGLMEQTIQNLLSNAFRHTPEGTTIRISATILNDRTGYFDQNTSSSINKTSIHHMHRLLIEVTDNGSGFPASEMEYAFDKFYRYPSTKASGTGLGLFIVKGFTEAQGGNVTLSNKTGGGTKFTLEYNTEILSQAVHHG